MHMLVFMLHQYEYDVGHERGHGHGPGHHLDLGTETDRETDTEMETDKDMDTGHDNFFLYSTGISSATRTFFFSVFRGISQTDL